ncbi:nicotinamide riboside kinase [Aspergillus sclerotialis]|uniref:Nicotinamide riboside kinase n=1 Tax=Aspergillus sclerotialis TaxID=2070753 RepID=A0A3A2ZTU8_9EURO|nr:nicotinamide riboside kinase [Aspergillus sclerotialis]
MTEGSNKAIIIGISGPSSSGKTTLARLLQAVFHDASTSSSSQDQTQNQGEGKRRKINTFIIHEDDFYYPDNRIPITTLPNGERIQDWDCIDAINVSSLSRTLAYVKANGRLPNNLRSIQDLNEDTDSGVQAETVSSLRDGAQKRLSSSTIENKIKDGEMTIVFLEGFLLFSPASQGSNCVAGERLKPVHDIIDMHLFLLAPYTLVKSRRESRSGYVTSGPAPAPPLPQRRLSSVSKEEENPQPEQQNFWTDPPGYVDDIVWPRYVRDHSWLLMGGKGEDLSSVTDERELMKLVGEGVNVKTNVGVRVAPGSGEASMTDLLRWAVGELEAFL